MLIHPYQNTTYNNYIEEQVEDLASKIENCLRGSKFSLIRSPIYMVRQKQLLFEISFKGTILPICFTQENNQFYEAFRKNFNAGMAFIELYAQYPKLKATEVNVENNILVINEKKIDLKTVWNGMHIDLLTLHNQLNLPFSDNLEIFSPSIKLLNLSFLEC